MVATRAQSSQQGLRRSGARLLAVSAALGGLAGHLLPCQRQAAFVPPPLSLADGRSDLEFGRRQTIASIGFAAAFGEVAAVQAEQAWQLKLPRTWRLFEQNQQPPPEVKEPVALIAAGNAEAGGELEVLKTPLTQDPKDPNFKPAKDLIEYFSTPVGQKPTVSMDKAVDAITASLKTQQGQTAFNMLGKIQEQIRQKRRYLLFEFEDSLCTGQVTKGVKGDACTNPEDNSPVPFIDRRHNFVMTVLNEGTAKAPIWYLWFSEITGPMGEWGPLAEAVEEISGSFAVGSGDELEAARTEQLTPDQMKALEEMKSKGVLKALDEGKITREQLEQLKQR